MVLSALIIFLVAGCSSRNNNVPEGGLDANIEADAANPSPNTDAQLDSSTEPNVRDASIIDSGHLTEGSCSVFIDGAEVNLGKATWIQRFQSRKMVSILCGTIEDNLLLLRVEIDSQASITNTYECGAGAYGSPAVALSSGSELKGWSTFRNGDQPCKLDLKDLGGGLIRGAFSATLAEDNDGTTIELTGGLVLAREE